MNSFDNMFDSIRLRKNRQDILLRKYYWEGKRNSEEDKIWHIIHLQFDLMEDIRIDTLEKYI